MAEPKKTEPKHSLTEVDKAVIRRGWLELRNRVFTWIPAERQKAKSEFLKQMEARYLVSAKAIEDCDRI